MIWYNMIWYDMIYDTIWFSMICKSLSSLAYWYCIVTLSTFLSLSTYIFLILFKNRFIIEQVSYFYRFSLRKTFENIDGRPPSDIDPFPWILSWIFVIGVLLFFVYWIFAWGVTNGGATLNDWGTDYSVAMIQDIFICETMKLCIMCVFAVISAKPQLQVIKRVINDCALSLVQDDNTCNGDINVVQSLSPSCRAAHMHSLSHLPSSAVLR